MLAPWTLLSGLFEVYSWPYPRVIQCCLYPAIYRWHKEALPQWVNNGVTFFTKRDETPVRSQWNYISFALSHRRILNKVGFVAIDLCICVVAMYPTGSSRSSCHHMYYSTPIWPHNSDVCRNALPQRRYRGETVLRGKIVPQTSCMVWRIHWPITFEPEPRIRASF